MRTRVVQSDEISPESLRASDYVYSPSIRVRAIFKEWSKEVDPSGVLSVKGNAFGKLKGALSKELAFAYEQGRLDCSCAEKVKSGDGSR
jgi:hypothetical protein